MIEVLDWEFDSKSVNLTIKLLTRLIRRKVKRLDNTRSLIQNTKSLQFLSKLSSDLSKISGFLTRLIQVHVIVSLSKLTFNLRSFDLRLL
jgi:hypothetical protein